MFIEINKPLSGGSVRAVSSKSQAHRLLICAALADSETYIKCVESSDDIGATAGCLIMLGAEIHRDDSGFLVKPVPCRALDEHKRLDCGESGSTLRFLLPVCCALDISAEFIMRGRLAERPMAPLSEQLKKHGCGISGDHQPLAETGGEPPHPSGGVLRCSGKLQSGVYELPGDVSSQFISGLLLALPLTEGDSVISISGETESGAYIKMTLESLKAFGIEIEPGNSCYNVRGGQRYRSPGTAEVGGDWSNAAFWLCAGAIGGNGVTCTGLDHGSLQGDSAIVGYLERFGADVSPGADSVSVKPAKLSGIRIDAADTPDLVPVLAAVAAVAEGETVIYNAGRLRIKESDRLRAVTETLRTLGADISETRDGLSIKGRPGLRGGTVSSFGDHRIAMMAAVASVACDGRVSITDAGAVNKSYPGFFRDFEALGGRVTVVT